LIDGKTENRMQKAEKQAAVRAGACSSSIAVHIINNLLLNAMSILE
jgi:hypothetical protein